jgi:hypothetical protein
MTHRLTGSCLGVALTFDIATGLLPDVVAMLPPGWTDGRVPGGTPRWEIADAAAVRPTIGAAELHVAEHAHGLVVIHAGVVAVDGSAILLPGRSLSGKSTLTAALVRAGATYYSDEYALLAPDGRVLPYPRPIALRPTATTPARRIVPTALGAVGTEPVRIRLIAHLRHDRDRSWDVTEADAGSATLALIDNAVAARSRPAEVLAHCAAGARNVRFVQGVRGEAEEAAARLRALLAAG